MNALRRTLAVVALVGASLGFTAQPSHAAGGIVCHFIAEITISPGLSSVPTAGSWQLNGLAALCWGTGGLIIPSGQMNGSGTYLGSLAAGTFSGNYALPSACAGRVNGQWEGSAVHGTATCTGNSPLVQPDECQLAATVMGSPNTNNPLLVTSIIVQGTLGCAFN